MTLFPVCCLITGNDSPSYKGYNHYSQCLPDNSCLLRYKIPEVNHLLYQIIVGECTEGPSCTYV